MTTNQYFESSYTAESYDQELYNSLTIECIQQQGRDYYYLPRNLNNFDSFFGEDVVSKFNDIAKIEMYLENISGWEGEQSFISKFGIELRDEASLIVSKQRFKEEVGRQFDIFMPREGDIIIFPKEVDQRIRFYEISYVDTEPTFYQLGSNYTYRLKVRNFDNNGEIFDTGFEEIDQYQKHNAVAIKVILESGSGGYFDIGETVYQKSVYQGTVLSYNSGTKELLLTSNELSNSQSASPVDNLPLNNDTGVEWTIKKTVSKTANIGNADNEAIEVNSSKLVNENETNPFLSS